jgi:hypothetical protein
VLFLYFSGDRILESNDEMILGLRAALVRSEHDGETRFIVEIVQIEIGFVSQQLGIGTATLECILKFNFIPFVLQLNVKWETDTETADDLTY